MTSIHQFGILPAFLNGVYEGDIPFKTIAEFGNIGLGTVNQLQGELIALDGQFYQMDDQGFASLVKAEQCTPYAVVSQFQAELCFDLSNINSLEDLNAALLKKFKSKNLFYMLRIDGIFEDLQLRSEQCFFSNHEALGSLLPRIQKKFNYAQAQGSLVISYFPKCSAPLAIPNFHYHYIDNERKRGGHVFNLKLLKGRVQMQALDELNIKLFHTQDYYNCCLDIDAQAALGKIE